MNVKQLNILVVEDNPIHLELIMKALKDSDINCQVDGTTSGNECLKIISKKGYDVILLDYHLPQMTGIEILEKIEKNKKIHSDPPMVIIVTGSGDERVAVEAMKKGAYDYIIKEGDYLLTLPMVVERAIETQNLKATQARMAEELIRAKNYTDNIIKSMIDMLLVVDPDGKIKTINKATSDLLGYKEDELIGKPFATIFAEEEEASIIRGTRLHKLIEEGSIRDYDMTYKTKSGEKIPVRFSGSVMRDKDGKLVGIVGIARDMREIKRLMEKEKELAAAATTAAATDRKRAKELEKAYKELKRADEALREIEALQRLLLANLPAGVVIVDPVTRVIERVNDHAAALFGASVDHLVGQRCHSLLCPAGEGACPVCDLGQLVDNSDQEMLRMDGSRLPILKTVKRIQLNGHEKLLECFVDVSKRKKTEEALKDKMHDMEVLLDAAMGREEKMVELKKRIKELEAKSGGKA